MFRRSFTHTHALLPFVTHRVCVSSVTSDARGSRACVHHFVACCLFLCVCVRVFSPTNSPPHLPPPLPQHALLRSSASTRSPLRRRRPEPYSGRPPEARTVAFFFSSPLLGLALSFYVFPCSPPLLLLRAQDSLEIARASSSPSSRVSSGRPPRGVGCVVRRKPWTRAGAGSRPSSAGCSTGSPLHRYPGSGWVVLLAPVYNDADPPPFSSTHLPLVPSTSSTGR